MKTSYKILYLGSRHGNRSVILTLENIQRRVAKMIKRKSYKEIRKIKNNLLYRPAHRPSGRVFANGPGDWGSISGRVIPKTQKMVLDSSLLNTQHYKVHFKGKVEQSRERSSALPYTSV